MLRNNLKLRQNHFFSSFYQFANSVSLYAATGLNQYKSTKFGRRYQVGFRSRDAAYVGINTASVQ
jgi:hypothetical protein